MVAVLGKRGIVFQPHLSRVKEHFTADRTNESPFAASVRVIYKTAWKFAAIEENEISRLLAMLGQRGRDFGRIEPVAGCHRPVARNETARETVVSPEAQRKGVACEPRLSVAGDGTLVSRVLETRWRIQAAGKAGDASKIRGARGGAEKRRRKQIGRLEIALCDYQGVSGQKNVFETGSWRARKFQSERRN